MKMPHFTRHGTRTSGDALDLFVEETALLRQLFAKWNTTTPDRTMGANAVPVKWDHGTIGKLLLEHAAVRLAAGEEIARVLQDLGQTRDSSRLEQANHFARPILDQMYDSSRGVPPMSVAITPGFVEAVEQLQDLLRPELGGGAGAQMRAELTAAFGPSASACAAPSSSASTRRRTLGRSAVGTTTSQPFSVFMPPETD